MRNLLWETHQIPHSGCDSSQTDHMLCSSMLSLPGIIFLNDEDDGFRMTWIMLAGWTHAKDSYVQPVSPSCLSITPSRHDIVVKSDEIVWDEVWSERYSGRRSSPYGNSSFEISFEAYFRVDALLDDIRSRRKATFDYRQNSVPDFHYNLISICEGRTVSIVIVFGKQSSSPSGPSRRWTSVGVFLDIDIITQAYEEIKWVQHTNPPESKFLREWSNLLALNGRMREQQVGPFCKGIQRARFVENLAWNMFYDDTNNDYDDSRDGDPKVWGQLLDRIDKSKRATLSSNPLPDAPKNVSSLSLFPDCDLITNNAVRSAKPVASIPSRNSPTELVYG